LVDFAAISGVLAGFCITLVVFILGWSVANTPLFCGTTWGNVGVLLTGVSSALFIAASEFFLGSKEFDVWTLPQKHESFLEKGFKNEGTDWEKIRQDHLKNCSTYEGRGRFCYNTGIILLFIGLWFIVGPYNVIVATIVSGLGIGLQLYQYIYYLTRKKVR